MIKVATDDHGKIVLLLQILEDLTQVDDLKLLNQMLRVISLCIVNVVVLIFNYKVNVDVYKPNARLLILKDNVIQRLIGVCSVNAGNGMSMLRIGEPKSVGCYKIILICFEDCYKIF